MHRIAAICVIALASAGLSADDAKKGKPGKCPISGKPGKPDITLFQDGKLESFCCKDCLATFRKNRENKLSDDEKKAGWRLVFNGSDLDGFQTPTRDGKWNVERGVLKGTGGKGVLATKMKLADFELQTDVRIRDTGEKRGNSGIFIRSTGLTAFRGRWPDGHEVQLDHGDPAFWTGSLFRTAASKKVDTKDGEWLQLRIRAQGPSIRVWVNGKLVTDYKDEKPAVAGPISLQVHHPTDLVEFKNVKIRQLETK